MRCSPASRAPWRRSFTTRPRSSPTARSSSAPSAGIVLGKKSGIDSIRITAARLGIELTDEQAASALAAVKERGVEKRGLVTDDEFRALLR